MKNNVYSMTAIPYSARHSRQTLRSEIPRRRMPSPMVRPDTMGKEKTTSVFQPRAFNQRLTNQQKHKARTSIDTAAELRIQARRPREPMMPPLKSGNPDNRPRSRHDLCTTTTANGVPPTKQSFSQKAKARRRPTYKTKAVYSSRTDGGTIFLTKKSKRSN